MGNAQQGNEPALVNDGVEAASVAARANVAERVDLNMADFSCHTGYTTHEQTVGNDTCSHSGVGTADVNEVFLSCCYAYTRFAECGEIEIVVDENGPVQH